MSKKLLMNNYSKNDEIVLCENYSPNRQPFYLWQDKTIDWDKYELYINVDIMAITGMAWQQILTISSTDITSWAGHGKLHLYGEATKIRIQPISGNNTVKDIILSNYNKQKIQVIVNKNGVYLEEELVMPVKNSATLQTVMNMLKTSNVTIGSAIPHDLSVCTYNKVSLRKYVERG